VDAHEASSTVPEPLQRLQEFDKVVSCCQEMLGSVNILSNENYPLRIREQYGVALDDLNALKLLVSAHLARPFVSNNGDRAHPSKSG
jgi:hypothetical protein